MKSFTKETLLNTAPSDRLKPCRVYDDNNNVYDLKDFIEDHPGGPELILDYVGQNVSKIMRNPDSHEHSDAAYEVLREYKVGKLIEINANTEEAKEKASHDHLNVDSNISIENRDYATDPAEDYAKNKFLDLDKPLVKQIFFGNFEKEFYIDQIHRPRHYVKGSAPLFGNFLEPFSKTPWYVIPTLWIPCIAYGVSLSLAQSSKELTAFMFSAGLCLWTLVEYFMHRSLFHIDEYLPNNRYAITLHFLFHGVHHYLPMDRLRLVMPPALFTFFASIWWGIVNLIFPYKLGLPLFCGGVLGYVGYDCCHYFLHHKTLYLNHLRKMKIYHLDHHYKDYHRGYGVTSKFWDGIFNTELLTTAAEK